MINNRQGGRRRGRGGPRGQNVGGQPGNRTDNRQRGNAAQLLEKYKNMARDSQLAGDRVQTEYFLQFADHYYRVLGESRARFEEQNPRRQRDDLDEDEGDDEMMDAAEDQSSGGDDRSDQGERSNNRNRGRERRPRDVEEQSADDGDGGFDRPERMSGNGETIPFDVLPPAIGRDAPAGGAESVEDPEPPRPRRRARTPRATESDSAPGA